MAAGAADVMVAKLPRAERHTLAGAGHIVNLEAPEAFEAGYRFACVWLWRQTWYDFTDAGKPINSGMWQWAGTEGKVTWSDEPTSGLAAITELNDAWR